MQVKHALCVYIFVALALGQGCENIHIKLLGNDLTGAKIEGVKPPGLTPFRKTAFSGIPVGNQLPTSPWGGNIPRESGDEPVCCIRALVEKLFSPLTWGWLKQTSKQGN